MVIVCHNEEDLDLILANGGRMLRKYPGAWLVEVHATAIGDVTYRLADGSVVGKQRIPSAISYEDCEMLSSKDAEVEWGIPRVSGDTRWWGVQQG